MNFRIDGFDELQRKLQQIGDNAREIGETREVPLSDFLTPEFLSACSKFTSLDEMFAASGFKIESPEDFKAIPSPPNSAFLHLL